jgi:thiol-disulfide isomerase/thioredoxin
MKTLISILSMGLLIMAPSAFSNTVGEVEIGGSLRDMPMQGLSANSRMLSDYRGKPLVINVWASWCGPCRDEMGSLEHLSRRGGGKHFVVIGISTDDYPEKARAFLKIANTSFSHFIDQRLALENMLGADRLPLTLLIDAKGRVLGKYYGARDWNSPESLKLIGHAFHVNLK